MRRPVMMRVDGPKDSRTGSPAPGQPRVRPDSVWIRFAALAPATASARPAPKRAAKARAGQSPASLASHDRIVPARVRSVVRVVTVAAWRAPFRGRRRSAPFRAARTGLRRVPFAMEPVSALRHRRHPAPPSFAEPMPARPVVDPTPIAWRPIFVRPERAISMRSRSRRVPPGPAFSFLMAR